MMKELIKQKSKAFSLHFLASVLIISMFIAVVLMFWYPSPLSEVESVWDILWIIIIVDVVLGPLLTFLVYKKNKPTLTFDISVIVLIQLLALGWGIYNTYHNRPVFMVFAVDAYHVVSAADARTEAVVQKSLAPGSWGGAAQVYMELPRDPNLRAILLQKKHKTGTAVSQNAQLYRSQQEHLPEIAGQSINLALRIDKFPELQPRVENFLDTHGGTMQDYIYLPVIGRKGMQVCAFDRQTGLIVDLVY